MPAPDMLQRWRPSIQNLEYEAMKEKIKIRGSETPDNPAGIVVTRAGAERFARQNMPRDLQRAGFDAYVTAGARGWNILYGKKVKP